MSHIDPSLLALLVFLIICGVILFIQHVLEKRERRKFYERHRRQL